MILAIYFININSVSNAKINNTNQKIINLMNEYIKGNFSKKDSSNKDTNNAKIVSTNQYILKSVNDHTMGNSLKKYLSSKVHNLFINPPDKEIIVRGVYNRSDAVIFKDEKSDKMFNWRRPTVSVEHNKYYLNVFPGTDYVLHYYILLQNYYSLNNYKMPKITMEKVEKKTIDTAINETNFNSIPKADIVVLGKVDTLVQNFIGEGEFKWVSQNINNKKILYLGCEFSLWGDIGAELIRLLATSKGVKQVIYVGETGTLKKNITPNDFLATGNISFVNGRDIEWDNIFDDLVEYGNIVVGKQCHVGSVLLEKIDWFKKNKDYCYFADTDTGKMALACDKNKIKFSYIHVITNNLNHNYEEDLSNGGSFNISEKRKKLFEEIRKIFVKKELLIDRSFNDNYSIRRKVKINNVDSIKKKIIEFTKASFKNEEKSVDFYFSNKGEDKIVNNRKVYLRILEKRNEKSLILHYIKDNGDWGSLQTKIDSTENMKQIFNKIDFTVDEIISKNRTIYIAEDCELLIDDIKNLGCFLQIKTNSEENLEKYRKALGLTKEELNEFPNMTYSDIMKEHHKTK